MDGASFKVDLHVHSKYSTRPSQWILQKISCPESFTEPLKIYEIARARGMEMVTVTDHNTLAGSLEIAHLPGAFVSEEITTYFPEDRCKLHVLAYDLDEKQHQDIQHVRENVFDLVAYLRGQGIVHALAHPLFAVNERLTPVHFEKSLLLFNVFEINGTRDAMQNEVLKEILLNLGPDDMDRLANAHGMDCFGETPWTKGLVGGSDDHSGLNIARMHTRLPGRPSLTNVLDGVALGRGEPMGRDATPMTMAHNLYGIAYQFYRTKLKLSQGTANNLCLRFADRALNPATPQGQGILHRIQGFFHRKKASAYFRCARPTEAPEVLLREALRLVENDRRFRDLAEGKAADSAEMEREWSRFVGKATDRVLSLMADRTLESVLGANIFDVFHAIGSAGSLYVLLAPYFVAYGLFASERAFSDRCLEAFGRKPRHPRQKGLKVAHFTDTLSEVNGVAHTIRQQLKLVDKHNKHMRVISCGVDSPDLPNSLVFEPVGSFSIPEYPELKLAYPPFLRLLAHCFEEDYDLILAATPGPMGLAALAIARILKKPFHGTYHTAFPQYVAALTGDTGLEDLAWRYMLWFYNQMDVVYSPSRSTVNELVAKGIPEEKIKTYPRGVDTSRFHPAKRNGFYKKFGETARCRLLYVGRVSKEKDLPVLCEAFRKLCAMRKGMGLVVVGDGPYLSEMRESLRGLPALFTGLLEGEDLAEAYASADLFVFPSTTDTFGNVVLEAQASGLPVIVTDKGGPCENMVPDFTGLVVSANDPDALVRAVLHLIDYPERLAAMRSAARSYVESRTFDATFLQTWSLYGASVRRNAA